MTQIRNDIPCLEVKPSCRNKIHRVLKPGREFENKLKHRSIGQRHAIPTPINPQPESPNAHSSAPKAS